MERDYPTEQYLLFIDLLGFSPAVVGWDEGKMYQLMEIVRLISTARSEHQARVVSDQNGLSLRIKPTISTFSDLAVISYPVEPPLAHFEIDYHSIVRDAWPEEVLRHMTELVARVAAKALKIDLLLRGGLCRGQLFHAPHMIVGPALVCAHHLESKIAKLPRIAVSQRVYSEHTDLRTLRKDEDGIVYLDYAIQMMVELESELGFDAAVTWRTARLQAIEANINSNEKCPKNAQKWKWFKDYFESNTLGYAESV